MCAEFAHLRRGTIARSFLRCRTQTPRLRTTAHTYASAMLTRVRQPTTRPWMARVRPHRRCADVATCLRQPSPGAPRPRARAAEPPPTSQAKPRRSNPPRAAQPTAPDSLITGATPAGPHARSQSRTRQLPSRHALCPTRNTPATHSRLRARATRAANTNCRPLCVARSRSDTFRTLTGLTDATACVLQTPHSHLPANVSASLRTLLPRIARCSVQ